MSEELFIYLDESGDLGFNFENKHPSNYFVITILISKNFSVLKTAVKRTLANKINHNRKKRIVNELKGSNTSIEVKTYFYNLLKNHNNWFLHTIVLDKLHLIKNTQLTMDKETIYSLLSKTVLEEIEFLSHATTVHLYIDKSKNAQEIEMFDAYIRTNLSTHFPTGSTLNIEHLNSEKNAGLQTVDMFCYGISKRYEHEDETWYNLFKNRIKREIIYRP